MSAQEVVQAAPGSDARLEDMHRTVRRIEAANNAGMGLLWVITGIVTVLFVGLILFLVFRGAQYLFSINFYGTSATGVGSEVFNTVYILVLAEVISLPIALAGAIYLVEYANR